MTAQAEHLSDPSHRKRSLALVLQGGGALGAYHVGAYQAMAEAGMLPDWVAGISIGAFMSALIAGNPPDLRVTRLQEFWEEISLPDEWGGYLKGDMRRTFNQMSYTRTLLFGQPNFWYNRVINPLLLPRVDPEWASFCDTNPMRKTLRRLVDFDLINRRKTRLSLGATRVTTGELHFFDSTREAIGPEHVMASGSLPPAFPPTRVGRDLYWDGGCAANTPLDAIFAEKNQRPDILVVIDLFNLQGPEPTDMDAVTWRSKSIQYGDRTFYHLRHLVTQHNLRCHLCQAHQTLASQANPQHEQQNRAHHVPAAMDILHLVYQPAADQIASSDAEFSRPSLTDRRQAGYRDMQKALQERPWENRERCEHPHEILVHHCRQGEIQSARYI